MRKYSFELNRQVFDEHSRGNRPTLYLLVLVLALTFVFYGFYGGLTRLYSKPEQQTTTQELTLFAEAVLYEPAWTLHTAQGGLDKVPQETSERRFYGQLVPVDTNRGRQIILGSSTLEEMEGFSLQRGRLPGGPGEVLVPPEASLSVGQKVEIKYVNPLTQKTSRVETTVVGIYEAPWSCQLPWLVRPDTTQTLLDTHKNNLMMGFEAARSGRYFRRSRRQSLSSVYRSLEEELAYRVPLVPLQTLGIAASDPDLPASLRQLGGYPSFDLSLNGPQAYFPGFLEAKEAAAGVQEGFALLPVMMTVLLVLFSILTLLVLNIFVGQQETVGIWRSLGVKADTIRRLYLISVAMAGLAGTLVGAVLYALFRWFAVAFFDQVLPIPWSSLPLWILVLVTLSFWGGRVASTLYTASPITSYLKSETNIDWWALMRFEW